LEQAAAAPSADAPLAEAARAGPFQAAVSARLQLKGPSELVADLVQAHCP
jgi:hypothetical protein